MSRSPRPRPSASVPADVRPGCGDAHPIVAGALELEREDDQPRPEERLSSRARPPGIVRRRQTSDAPQVRDGTIPPARRRSATMQRMPHSPTIRPMTPADVDPIVRPVLREDWGDRRLNLEFVTGHRETKPFVADADGRIVGTASSASTAGRLDRHDLGRPRLAASGRRDGTDPGDDRRRRGGRLPDARPGRDDGRPADVRADRLRGPDLVSDPRGARAAVRRSRSIRGSGRSSRADLPAMAALDAAATGEDRAHLLAVVRDCHVRAASSTPARAFAAASSSARRGAAARRSPHGSTMPSRSWTPDA